MTKHTKGPWQVLYSSNKYPSIHSGPTQTPVAVLYEYVSETDRDLLNNAEANAHLIAAAPELLKALKSILEVTESGALLATLKNRACSELLVSDLKKAIAKAEGGAR